MKYWIIALLWISSFPLVAQQKALSLEDAIINRYRSLAPDYIRGLQWIPSSSNYVSIQDDAYLIKSPSGKAIQRIDLDQLNQVLRDTLKRLPRLQWKNMNRVVYRSKTASKYIDLKQMKLVKTSSNPERGAHFDRSVNDDVAYTVDNNLYYHDGQTEVQITKDSNPAQVNGQAVSRHEFGISKGTFWSPKGNYLAFYRKDESKVHDYPLVDYMTREAEPKPIKYPMAGQASQTVQLGIYDLKTKRTIFIDGQGDDEDYLTNIAWSADERHIYIQELNRGQDHLRFNQYDAKTGKFIKTLFEEKSKTYVEPLHAMRFSKIRPNEFYLLSNRDGYFHVYKYDTNGKLLDQITKGNWEVTELVGFDAAENTMFFMATKESPLERHLYQIDLHTHKTKRLTSAAGMHRVSMSEAGNYFIDYYESTDVPRIIQLLDSRNNTKTTLLKSKDNAADYAFGSNKLVEIPCPDGKNTLYGRLILPADFDASKKYPVIVYVYGGPHSQMVTKSWKNAARWWQYYMAQKGYIAFTLDNRGTKNRGRAFEDVIHRQLGIHETADQMAGIDYLKSLPYVDMDRIGVHGWSYGGFMTINMMSRHPEVFKVGVAGGPVIDWHMYEIMYGERYMDRPQENPEGYKITDMTTLLPKLQGDLLIIHGVQDPVVVMQHSMKYLRESVKQRKQVGFFAYPTHPHNVRGMDRLHLMEKVSKYFIDHL